MGQVFLAVDERIGREVAIKFSLYPENHEAGERFRNELAITGALNHPNVIAVYDTGQFDGYEFLVMEYISGSKTLGDVIESHAKDGSFIPLAEIREWFVQAARALKKLHVDHGAWHRDIKPGNLLVYRSAGDSYLKILDFGLVRAPTSSLTEIGACLGTPAYMAPEWFQDDEAAQPLTVDYRADLYSLGLCLYVALTGVHPYPELFNSDARVVYLRALKIHKVRGLRFKAPSTVRPGLPDAWDNLAASLLEKDRALRCQSAAELEQQLHALAVDRMAARESNPVGDQKTRELRTMSPPARSQEGTSGGPSMLHEMVGSVMVVVHNLESPPYHEWDPYLRAMESERKAARLDAMIVRSRGGGPNARQRREVTEMWKRVGGNPPIAVVTESTMARGLSAALNFFLPSGIRVYPPSDSTRALEDLKCDPSAVAQIERKISEMLRRLG